MEYPQRKSPRLSGFDYSTQNFYFVTICTHNRNCLFGSPETLSFAGQVAKQELLNIPSHFPDVTINKYVIMPNHIHAIIVIGCSTRSERSRPLPTLSTIIGLYKSGVSRQLHAFLSIKPIWQASFFDRIIRNEQGYREIWKYIDENPLKWTQDEFYAM